MHHEFRAIGIGKRLRTKVNANIGASNFHQLLDEEVEKLYTAVRFGADSVMDLSTGTDLDKIRAEIALAMPGDPRHGADLPGRLRALDHGAGARVLSRSDRAPGAAGRRLHDAALRRHARERRKLRGHQRIEGIVSRGGALLAAWIERTGNENPLYEHFDEVCAILREHDVTISLGDGLRPGATGDATDRGQMAELLVLGELTERARDARRAGDDRRARAMCRSIRSKPTSSSKSASAAARRSTCSGPLTCDVAPGYDHITGAIGGAIAVGRRHRFPVLRHAGRASAPARYRGRARGRDRDPDRGAFGRPGQRRARGEGLERPDVALSQGAQLGGHVRDGDGPGQGAPLQGRERGRRAPTSAACAARCARSISITRRSSSPHAARSSRPKPMPLPVEELRAGDDLGAAAGNRASRSARRRAGWRSFAGTGSSSTSIRWTTPPDAPSRARNFATCTREFAALECAVVGVSVDSVESHRAFAEKHAIPFILLVGPQGRTGARLRRAQRRGRRRVRPSCSNATGGWRAPSMRSRRAATPSACSNFVRAMVESHRMLGG